MKRYWSIEGVMANEQLICIKLGAFEYSAYFFILVGHSMLFLTLNKKLCQGLLKITVGFKLSTPF